MAIAWSMQAASRRLKLLARAGIAIAVIATIAIPAIAGDFGPGADVQSVRAMWQKGPGLDPNNRLIQVVVEGGYAIAETHNSEQVSSNMQPNQPFLALYRKDPAENGSWQYQDILDGPLATCGLIERGIPPKVAAQFVARVPRLAADQHADPNWGCRGVGHHAGGQRPLSGGW
jgi:hypothetical protein